MKKNFILICFSILLCVFIVLIILWGLSSRICHHELIKIEFKESSCTVNGNIEHWQCTKCKAAFEDEAAENAIDNVLLPKAAHQLDKVNRKEANCVEDGNIEYWHCLACLQNFKDDTAQAIVLNTVIPKESHTLNKVNFNKASCVEEGNIEYWHCLSCLQNFDDNTAQTVVLNTVIPKEDHALNKVDYNKASCVEEGNIEYWHCLSCLQDFDDNTAQTVVLNTVIPKEDHALNKVDYSGATCTEDGILEHWHCSACLQDFEDDTCEKVIEDVIIKTEGHKFSEYEYDFDEKKYSHECPECSAYEEFTAGENVDLPILTRDEGELSDIIENSAPNSFIQIANDMTITSSLGVATLKEGTTLDFGGHTVTGTQNMGFIFQGTNIILQNGYFETNFKDPKEGYALFIGDIREDGENNSATLINIHCKGGINVFNSTATLIDCVVDSSEHYYYAIWADAHSVVTVEGGEYYGGQYGCVHSTTGSIDAETGEDGRGIVIMNGGEFHGVINATDVTVINGGTFDGDIKLQNYKGFAGVLVVGNDYNKDELNIISADSKYEIVESTDEDGNTVYTMKKKEDATA